jgi:hypothetical protein
MNWSNKLNIFSFPVEILIDITIAKLSLDIFCDREVHDAHEKFKMMECQPLICIGTASVM